MPRNLQNNFFFKTDHDHGLSWWELLAVKKRKLSKSFHWILPGRSERTLSEIKRTVFTDRLLRWSMMKPLGLQEGNSFNLDEIKAKENLMYDLYGKACPSLSKNSAPDRTLLPKKKGRTFLQSWTNLILMNINIHWILSNDALQGAQWQAVRKGRKTFLNSNCFIIQ